MKKTITSHKYRGMILSMKRFSKALAVLLSTLVLGTVFLSLACSTSSNSVKSLEDLHGKKIGMLTGCYYDQILSQYVDDFEMCYINTNSDNIVALENGLVSAYLDDEATLLYVQATHPRLVKIATLEESEYGLIFNKNSERAKKLSSEFNDFLRRIKANGEYEEYIHTWINSDPAMYDAQDIDYSDLVGTNGTITMVVSLGEPFCYYKNGHYVGYEISMMHDFCKEHGYDLTIKAIDFSAMILSISSGAADFGCGLISITEERKESVGFTDPTYVGGIVVVGLSDEADNVSLIDKIKDSFEKTFIRENRWKLFIEGILTTLLITISSVIFGTILGSLLFNGCRKGNRILNKITDGYIWFISGIPMVVLLLILFYLVLGKLGISGEVTSIVAFTLSFGASVVGILRTTVNAIDYGQTEGALALGYSENQAFFKMVLPQALENAMPLYKGEIVNLVKGTAIVGYIAIQDLTKISDLIRTRTYESFFSLIATAIIYFILAAVLTAIVNRIEFSFVPSKKDHTKILKGVIKHD